MEAIELALKRGSGRLNVYAGGDDGEAGTLWRWSTGLHCPESDLRYGDPQPALFSFNSAFGACDTCRGFGRVIGVDFGLVIPDARKTLRTGAIKPMQTPAWKECQDDLMKYAGEAGIPRDTAVEPADRRRSATGSSTARRTGTATGTSSGTACAASSSYLESKAYKMHIRVLLSKYRSYTPCARLRRRAAQARGAAVAPRLARPTPTRCCRPAQALHAGGRRLVARAARSAARPAPARPDAAADRAPAPLLRQLRCPARCSTRR